MQSSPKSPTSGGGGFPTVESTDDAGVGAVAASVAVPSSAAEMSSTGDAIVEIPEGSVSVSAPSVDAGGVAGAVPAAGDVPLGESRPASFGSVTGRLFLFFIFASK